MDSSSFVASRTRSRRTLESDSKNRIGKDTLLFGHSNSKRLTINGVRVRDYSARHELGFDGSRREHVFASEDCVGRRTRSRLGLENDSKCVGDNGDEDRVSSQKSGFDDEKMGASGDSMDWEGESVRVESVEIMDLEKEDSFCLNGSTHSAAHCVAQRTRSKIGMRKEDAVLVDLDDDETQSSSSSSDHTTTTTTTTSGHVSGASVGEEEPCLYSNGDEGDIIGTSLKRKTYSGICILVPANNDNCNSDGFDTKVTGIAKRTRSHCPSGPKKNIGTISNPYQLDVDSNPSYKANDDTDEDDNRVNNNGGVDLQSNASSEVDGDDDDDDDDDDEFDDDDDDDFNVIGDISVKEVLNGKREGNEKAEQQLGKSTKRKRIRAPQKDIYFKTLVNTILEEGEKSPEGAASPKVEMPHPLIFSFEDPVPEKEKSDIEKLEDDLWAEFNLAMSYNNIGSLSSSEDNNEETKTLEFEIDPLSLCRQGKHQFILDEQIGIMCRFCPFVKLEIKYVLPPLAHNVWGKAGKICSTDEEGISFLGGLPFRYTKGDSKDSVDLYEGTVWDFVPGIKNTMYPHQREGFEFMWKNLAGSIAFEELKKPARSDELGGCVISHAPGTGKTRLTIVFLETFMKVFPSCRPVILAPRSMILTWEKEFKKWDVDITLHILNKKEFSGKEDSAAVELGRRYKLQGANWSRLVKIYSWYKGKSILVLSYSLYERLVEKICVDEKESHISKILVEKPGLLVLDEGHTPRNEHSLIWKALEKIKTERRIILSGTPFQNNFSELYNTLWLVRPKFADKLSSVEICRRKSKMFSDDVRNRFPERREARGRWASLTNSIGKTTDDRLEELRSIINPFVHVHKGSILNSLPGLKDCLVYLHPPPLQKRILESIQKIECGTHFKQEYIVSMISVHPSLLMECSLSEGEISIVDKPLIEKARLDPNEGVKTRFVMELIRLCELMNEKVLVFSQYVQPLCFIKEHLKFCFNWTEGKEVLQMDGNVAIKQRQSSIDSFNDPSSDARVLLASTKACCEGINLVGASRVVLLDVVWNPSVERQAISRAYRIGQQKMVYTYHLITSGTTEGDKYYKQVEKEMLSELIFSSVDVGCDKKHRSLKISDDRILEEMVGHEKLKNIFEKILYQPKKSNLLEALEPEPLN